MLTYAAFLHGIDIATLERDVLHRELRKRGYESLAAALAADDQEGAFDADEFAEALAENLASGAFRLVLVLDDAPAELVRLVGYLEAVGGNLVIDLVTVTAHDLDGTKVMVPQRVEPERVAAEPRPPADTIQSTGYSVAGAGDFEASIADAAPKDQPELQRLLNWARSLEHEGLVRLITYHGKNRKTLLPRLYGDDVGLATIWNDNGAYISVWRSVFERRAPASIPTVEALLGMKIGNGNTVRSPSDEALSALTEAYRQAAHAID